MRRDVKKLTARLISRDKQFFHVPTYEMANWETRFLFDCQANPSSDWITRSIVLFFYVLIQSEKALAWQSKSNLVSKLAISYVGMWKTDAVEKLRV